MKQGTEECDRVARSARSECGAAIDRCISHISRLRDIAYVAAAAAAAAVGRVSSENLRLLIRKVSQSVSRRSLFSSSIFTTTTTTAATGTATATATIRSEQRASPLTESQYSGGSGEGGRVVDARGIRRILGCPLLLVLFLLAEC